MMYGFWGEGHTSDCEPRSPTTLTAERTFVEMTRLQLETWKKSAAGSEHAARHQPVGNAVLDIALRGGLLAAVGQRDPRRTHPDREDLRPAALARRGHGGWLPSALPIDTALFSKRAPRADPIDRTALHVLDMGGNYWSLWTEADNLARYTNAIPRRSTRSSPPGLPGSALLGLAAKALRDAGVHRGHRQRRRSRRARAS